MLHRHLPHPLNSALAACASPALCGGRPSVVHLSGFPAPRGFGATSQDSRAHRSADAARLPAQPGRESAGAEVPSGARARVHGSRHGSCAMPFLSRPLHIPPEEPGLPAGFASPQRRSVAEGCTATPFPRLSLSPPRSRDGAHQHHAKWAAVALITGDTNLSGSRRHLGFVQGGRTGLLLLKRFSPHRQGWKKQLGRGTPALGKHLCHHHRPLRGDRGRRRDLPAALPAAQRSGCRAIGGCCVPPQGTGAETRNTGRSPQPDKSPPSPPAELRSLPAAEGLAETPAQPAWATSPAECAEALVFP